MAEGKSVYTVWLLVSTVISSLSSFNFGYNIAVLATPEILIQRFMCEKIYGSFTENSDETTWIWSILVASYTFFGMFGACITGYVADKLGRKRSLLANHVFMFIGSFLEWGAKPFGVAELLIVGRSFVGFNCGLSTGMVSLYLTEIAPKNIRGAIGACHQMSTVVGILTAQVLGLPEILGGENTWNWLVAFSAVPALVSAIVFPFCPETPRYLLLKKNDTAGCKEALKQLRGHDDINEEYTEMEHEGGSNEDGQPKAEFKITDFIRSPDLRMPLLIAIVMQVTQQWSGISGVLMYSGAVFRNAKVQDSDIPYWTVGVGIVFTIATIISLPLIEKLGRRKLLLLPLFVMGLSMSCMTLFIALGKSDPENTVYPIICSIFVFVYIIGFAVGSGPIPPMIVAELFRQGPRPTAMAISQVCNWVCNLTLVFTFGFINKAIEHYTFLIFTGIIILCGIFIFFFVPETRNRTFDEIARDLAIGRRHHADRDEIVRLENHPATDEGAHLKDEVKGN